MINNVIRCLPCLPFGQAGDRQKMQPKKTNDLLKKPINMATMLRFKIVELDSRICFIGKKKKVLNYPVRSVSLIPEPRSGNMQHSALTVPEIFWQ
jgi:hypothetical protein